MVTVKLSLLENAEIFKEQSIEELSKTALLGDSSHKIEVTNRRMGGKYLTSVVYLLQDNLSGMGTVCPYSTPTCREVCLGTVSGRAAMKGLKDECSMVQLARLRRTVLLKKFPEAFKIKLYTELLAFQKKAKKNGVIPCLRFNGTSDLSFEKWIVPGTGILFMDMFKDIMFYDYTKSYDRMIAFLQGKMPRNYHLTYSYSPENVLQTKKILDLKGNVAVVFDSKDPRSFVGKKFLGKKIVTGDDHDLRFVDETGVVVGLTKKSIRNLQSCFFVSTLFTY